MILGIKPYMHIHEPGIQYLGLPRWGPNRFPFFHAVKAPIKSELAIAHNSRQS